MKPRSGLCARSGFSAFSKVDCIGGSATNPDRGRACSAVEVSACTIGSRAGHPKRQLVNPTLFHAPPLSYRDALMAGLRGRFRGRHGPGRGGPAEHRGRGGNAAAGRGAPDRNAQAAGHRGSSPAGVAAGRGGILLLCRLTVVVRLLAAEVKVHKEQAVKTATG
jgi:hypothetical protein